MTPPPWGRTTASTSVVAHAFRPKGRRPARRGNQAPPSGPATRLSWTSFDRVARRPPSSCFTRGEREREQRGRRLSLERRPQGACRRRRCARLLLASCGAIGGGAGEPAFKWPRACDALELCVPAHGVVRAFGRLSSRARPGDAPKKARSRIVGVSTPPGSRVRAWLDVPGWSAGRWVAGVARTARRTTSVASAALSRYS